LEKRGINGPLLPKVCLDE